MSNISLQMYTLRDYTQNKENMADTLDKVGKIGYRNVQISVPGYLTTVELKSMLDANGLSADSVFAPTGSIVEKISDIIRTASTLNTNVVRTDSIPEALRDSDEGYRKFAEALNKEGKILRENGITFLYHFHAFEFINFGDIRGIDILLNETDPDYVHFQPDVFWLTNAGVEPSSGLYMFKGRAEYMHVKDYAITKPTGEMESVPRSFAPVGMGNLNWPGILKAARDIGIRRFVVEQDMCDGDPFECIETSIRNLNKMGII